MIKDLEIRFRSLVTEEKKIRKTLKTNQLRLNTEEKKLAGYLQARDLFKRVSEIAQSKIKRRIESLVTMAIQCVYDRSFEYILNYKETKNNMLWESKVKEGKKIYDDIEEELGGGITDIIAFARKIIFRKSTRPILFSDEPFKNLGDLVTKAAEMVQILSKKLNLQFIIITHDKRLIEAADKTFFVERKNGITHIKED